jgi:hypothetical protein
MKLILIAAALLAAVHTTPLSQNEDNYPALNNLTSPYTLTAYNPFDCDYNGALINDFNVFQTTVSSYCPFSGDQANLCPNGTQQAFFGTLTPVCGTIDT